MKKLQNVFVLALIAIGLTLFFACDREECEDDIPTIEETYGEELSTLLFDENASIAEMFEGSEAELIGYLATEERTAYINFQHYEIVQAELGAEGFEEVWFVPEEGSTEPVPYEIQPIENLDFAAVPKAKDKFSIKKAKCTTLKKADNKCYDVYDPNTKEWSSLKLKEDIKICKITNDADDVCTFTKFKAAKVTAYPKRGCKGQGQAANYQFPDC